MRYKNTKIQNKDRKWGKVDDACTEPKVPETAAKLGRTRSVRKHLVR